MWQPITLPLIQFPWRDGRLLLWLSKQLQRVVGCIAKEGCRRGAASQSSRGHKSDLNRAIWDRSQDATGQLNLNCAVHHAMSRSEEHTSELQSPCNLVCRLLLEKKKKEKSLSLFYQITKKNRNQ